MSSDSSPISPPDDALRSAVIELKTANPNFGIAKIHSLIQSTHPEWLVSEKRTKKVLQAAGLTQNQNGNGQETEAELEDGAIYPASRVIEGLDISKWTTKVQVKYFGKKKGKGLVAKEFIKEGETIWKEDPFVIAPEWEVYDLQVSSAACASCTTPFSSTALGSASSLIVTCPASTSSTYCPARFCNRLCQSRSAKTHPLVCKAANPASVPLLAYAREQQWLALAALTACTSRLLLAAQTSDELFKEDWSIVKGLAELSMEERAKKNSTITSLSEADMAGWKKAYSFYVQAFKEPKQPTEQKKLAKLLKKSLPEEIQTELFEYEGFLHNLGRMSLNLEAHGGLYTLHSHLNHNCAPNVSVRHLDQRTALSRITVVAKNDIKKGEELLITYVNPESGVKWRQDELEGWGFGRCKCARCVKELQEAKDKESEAEVEKARAEDGDGLDMKDLAKELKEGFGVI